MKLLMSLFLLLSLASCAEPKTQLEVKSRPSFSYPIQDEEIEGIVRAYFQLGLRKHIRFKHFVSIGKSDIKHGDIIGVCTFGNGFREIDLDKDFWGRSEAPQKVALVYHEMTHCYCARGHDFDDGTYPEDSLHKIADGYIAKVPFSPLRPKGYLEDGCPKSIMHPIILSNQCFDEHYAYYVEEMFARCTPF